jgi:hypothetical protein
MCNNPEWLLQSMNDINYLFIIQRLRLFMILAIVSLAPIHRIIRESAIGWVISSRRNRLFLFFEDILIRYIMWSVASYRLSGFPIAIIEELVVQQMQGLLMWCSNFIWWWIRSSYISYTSRSCWKSELRRFRNFGLQSMSTFLREFWAVIFLFWLRLLVCYWNL